MTKLHEDALRIVEMMRTSGRPPFEEMQPGAARTVYAAGRDVLQPPRAEVAEMRDLAIPGPAGDIKLRLYRGIGTEAEANLPCLVFLHGGGWVVGDLESHDGICRRLANEAACRVVAVDYRLAPEHRFPAAVDDAAAAWRAVFAHAAEWRIDPARVAVGGDSAGGNLAAVLALMGRDGTVPAPVFQVLIYPVTDLVMTGESYERVLDGVPLTARTMRWFADHYTPDPAMRVDWRASPLRAPSLAGVAPAFVVTVSHDPLCDEGREYARRLEREGVAVSALHISDQPHGMFTMGAIIRPADLATRLVGDVLRAALHPA